MWRLQKLYDVFNGGQKSANGRKKVDRIIVAVPIPDVNNCREVLRKLDRNYSLKIKRIVVDLQHISHYELFLSQVKMKFISCTLQKLRFNVCLHGRCITQILCFSQVA